jgi:DNA-binding beta-propeller fold protein YncE
LVGNKLLPLLVAGLVLAQVSFAATYPLTITPGRTWPLSVVVDSTRGLVYFDSTSGEFPPTGFSFGVINATTHEVVRILPLDVTPGTMALDQENGDVFVAGTASIAVYDEANQAFDRNFTLGRPILSVAMDTSVSPDLYVTSGGSLLALNPQTGAMLGNASFPNGVDGIQLDPSNGRIFVGQYPSGGIYVLSASDLAVLGTIGLPGCCALQFALDVNSQSLYAATGTNFVYLVNAATDTFEKGIQVAPSSQNSTNAVVVDNDTGRVYVASSPGGSVLELNPSGSVVNHYTVLSQVVGLAVDAKTQELYASHYHQITVFDAARTRAFFFIIGIGVVAVILVVVIVFMVIRWKSDKERMEVQMGLGKSSGQK